MPLSVNKMLAVDVKAQKVGKCIRSDFSQENDLPLGQGVKAFLNQLNFNLETTPGTIM
ncbi:hypothetical protein [Arenibacter aquaticus]|uniref:hypothetical protein n=1 Tax=Arenibacter aquaticus TaxID=2489054 RepID=UPI001304AD3B|nr:hypothetical protein [Arenibacter aquaticus]